MNPVSKFNNSGEGRIGFFGKSILFEKCWPLLYYFISSYHGSNSPVQYVAANGCFFCAAAFPALFEKLKNPTLSMMIPGIRAFNYMYR